MWLVVGNGAGLAFTFNAVVSGAGCWPGVLSDAAFAFLAGLIAAFASAALSYAATMQNVFSIARLLQGKKDPGLTPLHKATIGVGYALLIASAGAAAWGLSGPLRAAPSEIQACAKRSAPDVAAIAPSRDLQGPRPAATENPAGTSPVKGPVKGSGAITLSD